MQLKESDLEIQRFRGRQELEHREKALVRRERELEIRERGVEERQAEYVFK